MSIKLSINKGRVPAHVWTRDIESEAMTQLANITQLPIIHHHIAAMPDVHFGIGATVGSVIPTRGAIIPAAVGVDIGCGMNAVRTSLKAKDLPDNLYKLRIDIEAAVPVGLAQHAMSKVQGSAMHRAARGLEGTLDEVIEKHPALMKMQRKFHSTWMCQLGTLGGGNHFVEVCLDEEARVWIMLHSGSRGIGNAMGRYFIERAKKEMGRLVKDLPDIDLAYLREGSAMFDDYVQALDWAQDYARLNRELMMRAAVATLQSHTKKFSLDEEAINCHHNYVSREEHFGANVYVTRKGAISAREGELGIIPGSMGAKSFIVRGKGNAESFCSCAHGAGRKMSRSEAKRSFTRAQLAEQTAGVECRKDGGVLDEIPGAYKDIDAVMENQRDLVSVEHTLKQVLCVKG